VSLDVYLKVDGRTVYEANITYNVNRIAEAAGCYRELWRPDEIGIDTASQLVEPLKAGLLALVSDPVRFEALNPENGWGSYDGLVQFVTAYLKACIQHPEASVSVWR
jgi:hypothetical protein